MHTWTVAEWQRWYRHLGRKPFAHLTKIQRARMVRGCIAKVVYDSHEEARRVIEFLPPIEGKGAGSYNCQLCHGIHIGNSRSRKGVTRMEYVKVESSQIAEVGFGEGLYGPETLALRFPPNPKQKEAGEPGSEYHYGNDRARYTPKETYQRLLAAPSIGAWFGQNIKPFPDQYPFTKVEAENPPQPPPSPNGGGATLLTSTVKQPTCTDVNPARNAADCSAVSSTTSRESSSVTNADTKKLPFTQEKVKTLFQSPNSTPTGTIEDAPSPGSALALMNDMADDLLFTPGKITDEQLATMRSDWLTEAKKYDISTDKARTELKRFARPLQKLRTGIEARAKELTGKMKRFVAGIDGEKRRLIMAVGRIEDEVLAGLTAWEQEEETRKTRLAHEVKRIGEMGQPYLYSGTVDLDIAIEKLEGYDPSSMQEYKLSAESAIAASLKVLKPELERRKVAEAERAELDRLRAESAARAEQDRIAAAAKKLADEQIAAAVEAAKTETRKEVVAELAKPIDLPPVQDVQPFVYPEVPAAVKVDAKTAICAEILEIVADYRSGECDTPGGLEHMGDVWRLFGKWERMLKE